MDHSVFTELSYVIAVAAIVAFVMRILKQPLIIGYILTGILVGPFILNIVHSKETFETFATLGIALLLFIIGLGLNPKVIKELGKVSVLTGTGQVVTTTFLGVVLCMSVAIGLGFQEALFVGIALAFSSTIIILKLISDKKEQNRLYGKITIGMLLVQDIIATFALVFVSAGGEDGISFAEVMGLVLRGSLLGMVVYMIGARILPFLKNTISGSQEFLFLFALGWGFGVATLFDMIGFSLEVGALFAGVALASLPFAQEVSARLRPLRDFFIVVFFISLGTQLTVDDLGSVLMPAVLLSALVIIINPIIVMSLLGVQGYTKRTSFKAGIAMAQISEFSLVFLILAQRQGYVDQEIVSMMTLVAMITIAVSSYMIIYSDGIYRWLEENFRMFEHRKLEYERGSQRYDMVLFGYQRGGADFVRLFRNMKKKFIVVDYNPIAIEAMETHGVPYIFGDATDIELLDEITFDKAKLLVSTITDFEINKFLVTQAIARNENMVIVAQADSPEEAMELYEHGASYVMLPHYIGSEKVGSFIKKNGFKKAEFKKYRQKHLEYISNHHTYET